MPQAIPYRRYSLGQKMTAVYYSSSLFYFVGMRLVIAHSTIAQVQYGAFPYAAVLAGVALFQCVAVSPSCQYDTCIVFR